VTEPVFLQAAGQRLEARFVGASPAGAPTLVFLHEGLGSVAHWKEFPDEVCARTGLGALVYSRRGYGASPPVPAAPRDVRYMHVEAYDVLPHVLDAARLTTVILVGHSDGASIALLHAAEDGGKRVRAVATLAPHVFVEDVAVKSIATIPEAFATTDLRERLARYHGENVDGAFFGWSGVWLDPRFRAWNIEREVARITVPVLVVQGEDDEYGTLAQVEAVKRLVRGPVRALVLPQCRHSPQKDCPEETCTAIADLVATVVAA
jgi:pimeloyl-ACP methyl ester carboxylesterase